ncbi:MAG: arginine--tRNA ligase [Nitrospiraceae bacterium]
MPQDIVRQKVLGALQGALERAKQSGELKVEPFPILTLDHPKRPEWGDLASTVAMSLATSERRAPHEVAQIILENMPHRDAVFDRVEIARPGYLNMTVKRGLWLEVLSEIESEGPAYGRSDLGTGRRVLVEFVSANPTGPLHVGHGRGAAVGQALANLLSACGYEVVKEYYVNDAGRQMKLLGASVYARLQQLQGREVPFPEDGYHGSYIEQVAAHIREQGGTALRDLPADQAEQRCRELAYEELLEGIRHDLRAFGIEFESWVSEVSLMSSGVVDAVLDDLRNRELLFDEDGALWFRSSSFGDEKDRVVRKQEGEYTYLASDIAYHRDKLMRGYDLLIDVWGADHHGYISRVEAAVQAYGYPKDRLRVVLVQMVHLMRGGKKIEMSKRAGEFVTLRDVIEDVGVDAAKFFFLMRRSDTHLDFDLELAKQRSAENPVYYVQYAHARIASLFRVAEARGMTVPKPNEAALELLQDPDEFSLIKKLSSYPAVVQASAAALEPHRLTFYLQELAGLLHTFYFKHRILPPAADLDATEEANGFTSETGSAEVRRRESLTPGLTGARLALMREVQRVIHNGLGLLGVSAPERM